MTAASESKQSEPSLVLPHIPQPPSSSTTPFSVSIVPSKCPQVDAETVAYLFPGRFEVEAPFQNSGRQGVTSFESSSSSDSSSTQNEANGETSTPSDGRCRHQSQALLVSKESRSSSGGDVPSRLMMMFIDSCPGSTTKEGSPGVGTAEGTRDLGIVPNATLVMEEEAIRSAIALIRRKNSEVNQELSTEDSCGAKLLFDVMTSSPSSASGPSCSAAMIRLTGGGIILLASPAFTLTSDGRHALAQFMARSKLGIEQTAERTPRPMNAASNQNSNESVVVKEGESSFFSDMDIQKGEEPVVDDERTSVEGESSIPMKDETSKPPNFPSLDVSVLDNGEFVSDFQINSRVGVPVETELFVGKILLILRPPNPEDDPYYNEKIFSKKKRRFEIQIQGRFKYVPTGTVYCGGEVTQRMKLGLVSKGLCNILLKVVSQLGSNLHYSYGDKKNVELPHIAFPAWTAFDKLVVTKPGETPPPMGEPFPESDKSTKARKASGDSGKWNTDSIYSMSFNSMYMDLPTWKVVNLSVMRDVDLHTFWGDSSLRIVVYEKGGGRDESKHIQQENKYLLALQMKFVGDSDERREEKRSEANDVLPWDKARPSVTRSVSSLSSLELAGEDSEQDPELTRELSREELEDYDVESDTDETLFFDAKEGQLGLDLDDYVEDYTPDGSSEEEEVSSPQVVSLLPTDMLCPGWIEMCESKGKYRKVYAFAANNNKGTVFRTASEFGRFFNIEDAKIAVEASCSPRVSSSEKLRRMMGRILARSPDGLSTTYVHRLRAFRATRMEFDEKFLRRVPPKRDFSAIRFSGFLARALSERHWIEEFVTVTSRHISFYHPEKQKASFRIALGGIVKVTKLGTKEIPNFPSYHFLAIETVGRTVYLMCLSESVRNGWVDTLSRMVSFFSVAEQMGRGQMSSDGGRSCSSIGSAVENLVAHDDPAEEFLHKSSIWSCKQRRILNCRRFFFSSLGQEGTKDRDEPNRHPCDAVEDALRMALEPMEETDVDNLRNFLNKASALKAVNIAGLTERERVAFFLNLYHVMVMHAFLVLGTPSSGFQWASYFNMIAYQCSDDIFSLTELEHCIIRAGMNYPSQLVAKFVLPKSTYRFALTRSDFRINFALNCGSLSNPRTVPVYREICLDDQLDRAARLYLKDAVQVTSSGKGIVNVTLPRICQWYAADFGKGRTSDIVRLIEKFLDDKKRQILLAALSENERNSSAGINVKFLSYSFKCRFLSLSE